MANILFQSLQEQLLHMGAVLVAFSGGVDSTLVLKAAIAALGNSNVLAVTAASEIYPAAETENARKTAQFIGARHLVITTEEMNSKLFVSNPPNRCYHCKTALFQRLKGLAVEHGLNYVVDGSNADDTTDYRPGTRAAKELSVRSPLQEAGFSKADIRQVCRDLGLPNWDKPGMPCLCTRIPYGQAITSEKLRQIDQAETFIRSLGIKDLRVRHHGSLARIEVPLHLVNKILLEQVRSEILKELEAIGFNYISLDLKGLRSGSFNETLSEEIRYGQ
ncbi:ATP-dependent sacrificial sulfur transferase LarE [Phosphitispora fastidiosa]|uniref:ATP-dependent sacrificial sulfur transferase LarE n=1 Tax=Phosphitispora fastidiosa TaxID=2837202 RepID=UPI001E534796|nr:ATP-dependent sacrificial sulfur transferase LarE [Phosphitispora fastidiosa]MBU7007542.1 uncharacterized protein [Phosphitispora fastidiosa]